MAHPPGTEPVAGHSGADGLRGAHARPLRRQPAGRPDTGKNAAKDEEDGNQKIATLPTFSNRQDQYTFRSPVTPAADGSQLSFFKSQLQLPSDLLQALVARPDKG